MHIIIPKTIFASINQLVSQVSKPIFTWLQVTSDSYLSVDESNTLKVFVWGEKSFASQTFKGELIQIVDQGSIKVDWDKSIKPKNNTELKLTGINLSITEENGVKAKIRTFAKEYRAREFYAAFPETEVEPVLSSVQVSKADSSLEAFESLLEAFLTYQGGYFYSVSPGTFIARFKVDLNLSQFTCTKTIFSKLVKSEFAAILNSNQSNYLLLRSSVKGFDYREVGYTLEQENIPVQDLQPIFNQTSYSNNLSTNTVSDDFHEFVKTHYVNVSWSNQITDEIPFTDLSVNIFWNSNQGHFLFVFPSLKLEVITFSRFR